MFCSKMSMSALLVGLLFLLPHSALKASWSSPVSISVASPTANASQVAANLNGNAVAVWERSDGLNTIIQAAMLQSDGTWSAPVNLSAAGQNALLPQIAINSSGNAVAVWQRSDGLNTIVQAATLQFGGSWSAPVDLSVAGQDADKPQIAINSSGKAVAVWIRSDGANDIVQAATSQFGGSWTAPDDLSAAGDSADVPQIAINSSGNTVAIWQRFSGASIVQAATLQFGGSWSSPVDLSVGGQSALSPQVAIGPNGNVVAVWYRFDGSNQIVQASMMQFVGSWSTPIDLSPAGVDSGIPQVVIDSNGNAIAVWEGSNGVSTLIRGAKLAFGSSTWTPTSDLSSTGHNSFAVQIAVDGSGNAAAVWYTFIGTLTIQGVTLPFGDSIWSSPAENLSELGTNGTYPQVAMYGSGSAVAVWQESAGTAVIKASTGTGFFSPSSPSQFRGHVINNRFATATDIIHQLKWAPSTDASVTGYHIYRNGKLIASIPASGPYIYKDHNRKKNKKDLYELTTISGSGTSTPVTTLVPN